MLERMLERMLKRIHKKTTLQRLKKRDDMKFQRAIADASTAFSIYALSLVAAFSWNNAVQHAIGQGDNWKRWLYATCITIFAVFLITIIYMVTADTKDDTTVVVGRMNM